MKLLDEWPVERPADWEQSVERPMPQEQLERVRTSVRHGRPLGSQRWVDRIARELGLEYTLRPRGRPGKVPIPKPSATKQNR